MPDELSAGSSHRLLGNGTSTKQDSLYVPYLERVFESLIASAICIAAITGNASLWLVVCMSPDLRTLSSSLVLCLSAADLTVSIVNMPVTVSTIIYGDWMFSMTTCITLGYINMVTFIASVMSLAAISISRYTIICGSSYQKGFITRRNTGLTITGVWLLSLLLAFPPLVGWAEYDYLHRQSFCFCNWKSSVTYTFFMCAACFGGPCTAMTFAYIKIIRHVKHSRKMIPQFALQSRASRAGNSHVVPQSESTNKTRLKGAVSFTQESNPGPIHLHASRDVIGLSPKLKLATISEKIECNAHSNSTGTTTSVGCDGLPQPIPITSNKETAVPDTTTNSSTNHVTTDPESYVIGDNCIALRRHQEELRLSVSLLVVIAIFVIAWLPYCIAMFWSVFSSFVIPRPLDMFTLLLGYFNSCCNPVVYGVMNTRFRRGFCRLRNVIFRVKNRSVPIG